MSDTPEEIGGRKWSLLKFSDNPDAGHTAQDEFAFQGDELYVMEGTKTLAALTHHGAVVKALLVTAPQLWEAANDYIKAGDVYDRACMKTAAAEGSGVTVKMLEDEAGAQRKREIAFGRLCAMVAKSVGKTDWKDVAQ